MPSPRLAAHSRNQPKLPHSATQKQGGIKTTKQKCTVLNIVSWSPFWQRTFYSVWRNTLHPESAPTSWGRGRRGGTKKQKANKHSPVSPASPPSTHQTIHENQVLFLHPVCGLPALPSCWTLREYLYDLPWTSNLGVILLQLGPLMSYIADGDVYPRRQLQMVMRDLGDSH